MQGGNAAPLTTYYAVDAIGYRPPSLPALDVLDVPYLGTMVLDAARLPLSDAFRARKRLMLLCNGRYSSCPAEDEVLIFHRRLLSSGVVDAQPIPAPRPAHNPRRKHKSLMNRSFRRHSDALVYPE